MTTVTVIYVQATGHVLGAVTSAAPAGVHDVSTLVGPGLPLPSVGLSAPDLFIVPADALAVASVDQLGSVLESPRTQQVVETEQNGERRHELQPLSGTPTITLSSTGATVGSTAVAADRSVVVVLQQAGSAAKTLAGKMSANATSVTLAATLESGIWRAMVFLGGLELVAAQFSVSAVAPVLSSPTSGGVPT